MSKLYVGNLSYQMEQSELETAFGTYGTVKSVKIITDRDSGRSKGFGFIEMDNSAEANEAIENLNGKEIGGRNLNVSAAREREDNRSRY